MMTDKQQGTLEAIELAAGLEARRIANAAVQAAIEARMLPMRSYHVQVNVEVGRHPVATLAAGAES